METSIVSRADLRRYGVVGLSVILVLAAVTALRPWFGENIPSVVLMPAVLLGAWYGGLAAGLVSTALNALAADYFLIPPIYSFRIGDRSGWVHLGIIALQGVLISWLCESRQRAASGRSRAVLEAQQARSEARICSRALSQANADMKHFTAAFVRDIEIPLGRLSSLSAQIVERCDCVLDRESEEYLRTIEADAARVSSLAKGLGCYAHVASELPRKKSIDSRRLVDRVLDLFAGKIGEARARVMYAPLLPEIEVDESQLLQLFSNLIDNAIKFRRDEAPRVRIYCEQRGGDYLFSVADNGIGIVPAHCDEAFAAGRRLHGETYSGAGMGLSIAKRIIENHGGEIWLSSEPGRGTTVRFTIPRRAV